MEMGVDIGNKLLLAACIGKLIQHYNAKRQLLMSSSANMFFFKTCCHYDYVASSY
jgi:hypothetical protein